MVTLTPTQARYLRLRAQRLVSADTETPSSTAQVVRDLCGIQAQDPLAALLAVGVRSSGLPAHVVETARAFTRSIVRAWCMRGTLHLLAAEDVGWLLPLLGPVFVRRSGRRYAELGLDEGTCARAIGLMRAMLADLGPMTRGELAECLAARSIPTAGQAAYHLVRRAGLEGVVCLGPERADEPTYVLLEDWVRTTAPAMEPDAARAELARRYLAAYGPAGPHDLAAWSGLSLTDARAGFEAILSELLEVDLDGVPAWLPQSRAAWLNERPPEEVVVRLLPAFDPYLLGYRNRDLVVPPDYAKRVHPGGGVLRPTLLVDGVAAGTWEARRSRGGLVAVVELFEPLGARVTRALEEEVRELGLFLDVPTTLRVEAPATG